MDFSDQSRNTSIAYDRLRPVNIVYKNSFLCVCKKMSVRRTNFLNRCECPVFTPLSCYVKIDVSVRMNWFILFVCVISHSSGLISQRTIRRSIELILDDRFLHLCSSLCYFTNELSYMYSGTLSQITKFMTCARVRSTKWGLNPLRKIVTNPQL